MKIPETKPIVIDEEFRDLIPPLSETELENLHRSMDAFGCRDNIIVWKKTGIVLDGHNRYAYCMEHGIPFSVTRMSCSNRDTAKNWMILNQLGRRNMDSKQQALLRGKFYNGSKKAVGGDRGNQHTNLPGGQNGPLPKTAETVAKETGVSPNTVKRDGKFAEAVEYMGIEKEVMSGTDKRTRSAIMKVAQEMKIARGEVKRKEPAQNTDSKPKAEPYLLAVKKFKSLEFEQMEKAMGEIDKIWKAQ